MGGVPLSVQGPRASHQEPAADVDPEVVAMVTCVEEHMRFMGWTKMEGSGCQALRHVGRAHRT